MAGVGPSPPYRADSTTGVTRAAKPKRPSEAPASPEPVAMRPIADSPRFGSPSFNELAVSSSATALDGSIVGVSQATRHQTSKRCARVSPTSRYGVKPMAE